MAALAGQANTATDNTQFGAAVVGGGTGGVSVNNDNSSGVLETGSATARSGMSIALVPTPAAGTPAPRGVTTASSGSASANGVTAQNAVTTTQLGAVQIAGQNQANVNLTANSDLAVSDTGASLAQSGQAWAVAAGAAGAPSNVATPIAGSAPASAAISATGATIQNTVALNANATVTVPLGATPSAINVASGQSVSIVAGGNASASSGAACAGAVCAGSAVPTGASAAARAASGAAAAQGLAAQNTVNTTANASVRIGGQNFAPIQVIINTVTQIFNWGGAVATTGDTTASGGGPSTAAAGVPAQASSGSAQATGAQVQNTVDLRSSASVHVAGDNHNPINMVLDLAANMFNWGTGSAQSGDAQSAGGGAGGSASSGSASATGLQAVNLINLWADASVDIEGNNYAPIRIEINFDTTIRNFGAAAATTGNVAAGKAGAGAPAAAGATQGSGTPGSSGSPQAATNSKTSGSTSLAQGGSSVAIGNVVDANVVSQQLGSANGSHPLSSTVITNMLHNLPAGSFDPLAVRPAPVAATPTLEAGTTSRGGDSLAAGMQSSIEQHNSQLAACADPGVQCLASNVASLQITSRDVAPNPVDPHAQDQQNATTGCGICSSASALVGVNVTPTPTPTALVAASDQSAFDENAGSSSGGSRRRQTVNGALDLAGPELVASGHTVTVDLWDQWPGRRLPPMPNPVTHAGGGSTANASLGNWPGADELPLPLPESQLEVPAESLPVASPSRVRLPAASADQALSSSEDDDEGMPPLGIYNVTPMGWPGAEPLPLPLPAQAARAGAVASGSEIDDQPVPVAVDEPPDSGVAGIEFGPAVLLAIALGALGGTHRGRLLLPVMAGGLISTLSRPRLVRGLSMVRLTLGVLRLWILNIFGS